MNAAVIIPFRDRGRDPQRAANLVCILDHWDGLGYPVHVVDDGRSGDQQFNRHAAYNEGARKTTADVLVYAESDMLINPDQITTAIGWATESLGLVVPFTERHELNAEDSAAVRADAPPETFTAEVIKPKPRRIGAINVLTRDTLTAVGQWDEAFEGCWWDDRSMHIAFDKCAGPTRWVQGPAYHLWHLPGWTGSHLTAADKAATERNHRRFQRYQRATTPDQVRDLTTSA
jgi:hypothetical protein